MMQQKEKVMKDKKLNK